MKDKDGNWQEDLEVLRHLVLSFFQELYQEKGGLQSGIQAENMFPKLERRRLQRLGRRVAVCEVERAVFSMKANKALGLDRVNADFY